MAEEHDDDPFAVFDDDDDEDEDGDEDEENKDNKETDLTATTAWKVQQLIKTANQKMAQQHINQNNRVSNSNSNNPHPTTKATTSTGNQPQINNTATITSFPQQQQQPQPHSNSHWWNHHSPLLLYQGPIQLCVQNDDKIIQSQPQQPQQQQPQIQQPQIQQPQIQQQYGGGRALVASRDLSPGTLILVETPLIEWPDTQLGQELGLVSIAHIITATTATTTTTTTTTTQMMIHDLELLHPTKEAVDRCLKQKIQKDAKQQQPQPQQEQQGKEEEEETNDHNFVQITQMIQHLESLMEKEEEEEEEQNKSSSSNNDNNNDDDDSTHPRLTYSDLVQLASDRGLTSRNGEPLTSYDMMRLLLVCRYNGFESGIYLHLAMINHDCYPNCVKFAPRRAAAATTTTGTTTQQQQYYYYSEVRTTRFIPAGEAITISYLPRIMSHASRRHYLWDQHRFDIGPEIIEVKEAAMGNKAAAAAAAEMERVGSQSGGPGSSSSTSTSTILPPLINPCFE